MKSLCNSRRGYFVLAMIFVCSDGRNWGNMNIIFSFLHPQKKSQCFIWHSLLIKVFFCTASQLLLCNSWAGQKQFLSPHSSFQKKKKKIRRKSQHKPQKYKPNIPKNKAHSSFRYSVNALRSYTGWTRSSVGLSLPSLNEFSEIIWVYDSWESVPH